MHSAPAPSELGNQAGPQHRPAAVCRTRSLNQLSVISRQWPAADSAVHGPLTTDHRISGAIMEVILKEDVAKLGSRGDVIKVAEGYGRNFLLPRKLAIEASAGNKKVIDQMRAAAVRRSAKEKTQAEELSKQFDGLSVSFQRRSGENDQLFGSVTSGDIADALEKKSFNIDRRKIQLHEPLKTLGEFTIPVKLHKDVTAHLKVVIEKEAVPE
jgi:large subunit ribosomal protein L9